MKAPLPPAIVLAAGIGRRLAPLTRTRAKPAVPVAGTPLILRVLAWLGREGVRDVVLNLHHRPETITRVVGHGARAGVTVRYSWEPDILGSAGGPRQALSLLGPRFFIVNGDTLVDLSLDALRDTHERTGAAVTLAVRPNPTPERYGGVIVDEPDRVHSFTRPGHATAALFVGVQMADAAVFANLPARRPASSVGGVYDALIADQPGAVRVHRVTTPFLDVGTPGDYLNACLALAEVEALDPLPAGDGSIIHPSASLTRTAVWDRVVVEERCRVHDCVLGDDVRLPAGSRLERQVVVRADGAAPTAGQRRLGDLLVSPIWPEQSGNRTTPA